MYQHSTQRVASYSISIASFQFTVFLTRAQSCRSGRCSQVTRQLRAAYICALTQKRALPTRKRCARVTVRVTGANTYWILNGDRSQTVDVLRL